MSTLTQPAVPRLSRRDLARYIDHTALKPEVTAAQITQLCEEAQRYHFMAVSVNPVWVKRCASLLSGSDTCAAAMAGFPLGATLPEVKAHEAQLLVESGARDIEMVVRAARAAGANRIGASASVKIMQEADQVASA